jgi:hypothetical protein
VDLDARCCALSADVAISPKQKTVRISATTGGGNESRFAAGWGCTYLLPQVNTSLNRYPKLDLDLQIGDRFTLSI